ncbi:hypothetical protein EC957_008201 [Mortierella hygrophila]|uniref:Uncharacterized protein n=1 Tax=Mortierella hygrophila TaxID=979708 RepID=A0A9P6FJI3_9FUNG|nr:hypothetical protein EC957_008201 [Mortierella hygrophila]
MTRANSSASLLGADTGEDTVVQVSAASDGTVVRLDRSLKAWYMIAPQNDHVDYEKDVIWIDLGHFWKCVSVASISQIWGLSDYGDIYYGTSDRFVLLEHAITSGAGYNKPTFTHISVGHDNVVLATDAHSGTVFRLKLHPTGACPPVWNALPGTGPGSRLHIVNCSLSTGDFIVGVAGDGRVYRYSRGVWTSLGGGAKLNNVGVGIDGYVLGVDRDGDLFGCQLESTAIVIPPLDRPSSRERTNKSVKDDEPLTPSSPQAPNGPSLFNAPRQQGMSRKPTSTPRELFEMAASTSAARNNRFTAGELRVDTSRNTRTSSPLRESGGAGGAAGPGGSSWAVASPRTYYHSKVAPGLDRTDSQMSKRSYASDVAIFGTPTGPDLSQPTTPVSPQVSDNDRSSSSVEQTPVQEAAAVVPVSTPSHARATQLRIQTKGMSSCNPGGESHFTSQPITTFGPSSNMSPLTSFPLDGNPYATGSKPSSDNSAAQTPITPHSDSSNNFILSASSKSSSGSASNNNLLTTPAGQQNANPQKDTVEEEENHSSIVDGATPPASSSISPSVSSSDRVPCVAATGLVPEAQGYQRQPVLEESEERLEQHFQQPDEGAFVESAHGSVSLPNANGPATTIDSVEMAMAGIYEPRDIHSIFDPPHDPLPPASAAAVGTVTDIDSRQPLQSPLPPPPPSQPAVVDAVVPSSLPQQRMELDRLLSSSDKSEWIENGVHPLGRLGQTGDNNYNNDEMNDGVNIAGLEGQKNNDDGHVWYGDTAVVQPNLDQDKRNPSMAFSHLEQPTPTVLSTITRTSPAITGPFQAQSSRTISPFSTQGQQQQQQPGLEYNQSKPPFSGNSNSYYNDTNNSGQPKTTAFLPLDIRLEPSEPPSSSVAPLSVFHQQQQEENHYLEPPYSHQDHLSQRRPSDCSEVLMLQQQEFLRLTRLRSQPSSVVTANDPALGAFSEKTEVLQDYPLSDKTEIDFINNSANDSSYQLQQQKYQDFAAPSRQSQDHYDNNNISPDNNETMLRKVREKMTSPPGEEGPSKRLSVLIPPNSLPPESDEILRKRESAKTNRASNNIPNASAGSSGRNSRSSSSRGNANMNYAIPDESSHPSYSSTHLQNYVNTTMPHPHQHPQSGRSSVQSINLTPISPTHLTNPTNSMTGVYNFNTSHRSSSSSGAGRSPYGHGNAHGGGSGNNNRTTTTVGSGVARSASSGGIAGEDAQGRWVGSPTGTDNRVSTYGTADIHKSRCCIIQ